MLWSVGVCIVSFFAFFLCALRNGKIKRKTEKKKEKKKKKANENKMKHNKNRIIKTI